MSDTDTHDHDDGTVETASHDLPPVVLERITAIETKANGFDDLAGRLDRIETRLARPGVKVETAKPEDREVKAFEHFVRQGREALGADEIKDLRVSDATAGGYLAPDQFVAELIRNLVEISPVRAAARIGNTTAGAVILPRRTARLTASWVGETEARPETQPTYGQVEVTVHEMACFVDVSNQLLEDSGVDIAAELAFDFAEEMGRLEGASFITGDGIKKPLGLLNVADIPYTPTGAASDFPASNPADVLIDLFYALPTFYSSRAAWMMNRSTMAKVRKFKDQQGQYLWMEGIVAGQPPTLLGRPVIEAPDLPNVGASAEPIIFGDFSNFRIYDRVGMSVLRDPYSVQTNGLVRFHARRRLGAAVVRAEAFRKLRVASS
jgi:HK97 family phage major capsid protein